MTAASEPRPTSMEFRERHLGAACLSPTLVAGEGFVQVAVGRFHTCALKTDDSVWCTGANDAGQLGLGSTDRTNAFTEVTFP